MRVGLLIIGIILVVFSCRKNAPQPFLPSISTSGEHTLGFFLNNETWIPYDRGNHESHELPPATLTEDGRLKISATRIDESNSSRNWFCLEVESGCLKEGVYDLSNRQCKSPYQTYYYGNNKDRKEDIYMMDTLQAHFIEIIHLDTDQQIISGKFQFDATTDYGETIQVRSGRFDLKYEKL